MSMRIYKDPRKDRPRLSPSSFESGGAKAPAGASGVSRSKVAAALVHLEPKKATDSDDESEPVSSTERALMLQVQKAKLELARAETEYLKSLLEVERQRSRSLSAGPPVSRYRSPSMERITEEGRDDSVRPRPCRRAPQRERLSLSGSESEFATYMDADQCSQLSGYSDRDVNPFMSECVIDSDDEFLSRAVKRRNEPLRPLYVEEKQGFMVKLKKRFSRLFRRKSCVGV